MRYLHILSVNASSGDFLCVLYMFLLRSICTPQGKKHQLVKNSNVLKNHLTTTKNVKKKKQIKLKKSNRRKLGTRSYNRFLSENNTKLQNGKCTLKFLGCTPRFLARGYHVPFDFYNSGNTGKADSRCLTSAWARPTHCRWRVNRSSEPQLWERSWQFEVARGQQNNLTTVTAWMP